jgi:osmotically-inducible protein OsmY
MEKIMLQDSQLQKAVIAELGWEPSVDSAHIGVTAHAGVVTLNGHVRNFSQKLAAEKAVGRVKGVKAVAEEIEVKLPFDVERSDEDIAAAAIERLAWDSSVPRDAVMVRVEKGWVTLSGKVDWHYEKEAAALGVGTLHGVIGVSNQILIKPVVDTRDVAADITLALHRSWYYDPNTIKVSAQGGEIKLTGNVTTWNARDLAETAAWSAPGATFVKNDIHVVS